MRSKTVIAATFGMDSAEMEDYRYQMTRTSKAIYAIGNAYYTTGKNKPKDDMGGEWKPHQDQFWAGKGNTILWVCGVEQT